MSRRIRPGERAMRSIRCSYCSSPPGQPCYTESGRPRSSAHADRFYDALSLNLLPVKESA